MINLPHIDIDDLSFPVKNKTEARIIAQFILEGKIPTNLEELVEIGDLNRQSVNCYYLHYKEIVDRTLKMKAFW